jgi:menaquinone-specific isochorismate synthase
VAGNFGASPELLVRVSHGQVSARVLAGTAARGASEQADQDIAAGLLVSEKNLHEHQFAVESMVQELTRSRLPLLCLMFGTLPVTFTES